MDGRNSSGFCLHFSGEYNSWELLGNKVFSLSKSTIIWSMQSAMEIHKQQFVALLFCFMHNHNPKSQKLRPGHQTVVSISKVSLSLREENAVFHVSAYNPLPKAAFWNPPEGVSAARSSPSGTGQRPWHSSRRRGSSQAPWSTTSWASAGTTELTRCVPGQNPVKNVEPIGKLSWSVGQSYFFDRFSLSITMIISPKNPIVLHIQAHICTLIFNFAMYNILYIGYIFSIMCNII